MELKLFHLEICPQNLFSSLYLLLPLTLRLRGRNSLTDTILFKTEMGRRSFNNRNEKQTLFQQPKASFNFLWKEGGDIEQQDKAKHFPGKIAS